MPKSIAKPLDQRAGDGDEPSSAYVGFCLAEL